ncbi:MAG: tandem-95 repeat protein, partial [Deltaproteobacteria bacterium]|nr:tandem-95 repeat protein [Deltaproteobacteria bacterium]
MPFCSSRQITAFLVLTAALTACGEAADIDRVDVDDGAALLGIDGDLTLAAGTTILNEYAVVSANVAAGASSFIVANVADLSSPRFGALAAGDLLLLYQAEGATIDVTNTAAYGTVSALGSAGLYELTTVSSVNGNTINVACRLTNAYTTAGRTQAVRVPRVSTLTVPVGATLTSRDWDGTRGGIVAVQATKTITVDGAVDVVGRGFRGGSGADTNSNNGVVSFRSGSGVDGGEKGESIAGDAVVYATLNGNFGRGAPANGGGGGDAHNAGGGGGANGDNGRPYNGIGVMDGTVTGAAAYNLDPDFIANGNALTTSSGGGRGGYTFSDSNQNALTLAPGNGAWAGDSRRNVGGRGGHPLPANANTRVFFGGGGGAGDRNNAGNSAGGDGGGLVLLLAPTVAGTGAVNANGSPGGNTGVTPSDAPGGGGAGGSVIVQSTLLSGVSINANGAVGGTQPLTGSNEAEGPGGGGGGGFVATSGGVVTIAVNGASAGTSQSAALTEFPSNGGTRGANGLATPLVGALPICDGVVVGCGNAVLDEAEECDDGNLAVGDGCDSTCEIEAGALGVCSDGSEGNVVVAAATVLNTYFPGVGAANRGTTAVRVGTSRGAAVAVAAGDLLLLVQAQGAEIDTGASLAPGDPFGDGATFNDRAGFLSTNVSFMSGRYERVRATSAVVGGVVQIAGGGPGGGLINSYLSDATVTGAQGARAFQIVRVPEPRNLALNAGGSLQALEWNGSSGGVVAVAVLGTTTFAGGSIDASSRGFRGGQATTSGDNVQNRLGFAGAKGEGIAGTPTRVFVSATNTFATVTNGYPVAPEGVGAPGNGGSGAVRTNDAAGGGGGNVGRGGRGGRGTSNITSPDNQGSGIGGVDVFGNTTPTRQRLSLGGGGGGSSGDDALPGTGATSAGQSGGGLLLLWTNNVAGNTGSIVSNGATQPAGAGEGGGGGGAGGTILVSSNNRALNAAITVSANGGAGVSMTQNNDGGGGGGGGGQIVLHQTTATTQANGGAGGTSPQAGAFNGGAGTAGLVFGNAGDSAVFSCVFGSPPVAVDDAATTNEDTAVTVAVLANDSDPDGDALTARNPSTPAKGTAVVVGVNILYTPALDQNGSDSFTYQACDTALLCTTATVTITITPVNDAPIASNDAISVGEDSGATVVDVLANDTDVDSVLSVTVVTQPPVAQGSVTLVAGVVRFTPALNFNGSTSFTYTASDGALTSTATVSVTVTAVNDAPVANNDAVSVGEDSGATVVNVLANDTDVDSVLSVTVVTQPPVAQGAVTLVGGVVRFTPALN